jgi:hypothetical protein
VCHEYRRSKRRCATVRESNGRRQPSRGGTSRMTRECQVRICERLGVKFPGPTRQSRRTNTSDEFAGCPLHLQLLPTLAPLQIDAECQDLPWSPLPCACESDVALPQSCQQDVPRSYFCGGSGDAVGRHLTQTFILPSVRIACPRSIARATLRRPERQRRETSLAPG